MKKTLSVLLALLLLFSVLPVKAAAAEVAGGSFENTLWWSLDDAGTLTIGGNGEMLGGTQSMPGFVSLEPPPWQSYREQILHVVVLPGVTGIGVSAFQGCKNLLDVSLPEGITTIRQKAMDHCEKLERVNIPSTVQTIEEYAFSYSGLSRVEIPGSVRVIRKQTFYQCPNLTEVVLGEGVEIILTDAFSGCPMLRSISIPSSLKSSSPFDNDPYLQGAILKGGPSGYYKPWNTILPQVDALYAENGEYLRLQDFRLERYDSDFHLLSSRLIDQDLSYDRLGAFYAGESYNFLLYGNYNKLEQSDVPVFIIVKYDKDWNELGRVSLPGYATRIPFETVVSYKQVSAGFAEADGLLYIRTIHTPYRSENVDRRSLTIVIRESDMAILFANPEGRYTDSGTVYPSDYQYVLVDQDGNIVTFDKGCTKHAGVYYPYLAVLGHYAGFDETASAMGAYQRFRFNIDGKDTFTDYSGCDAGGLAETVSGYVTAERIYPNAVISYTPKDSFSAQNTTYRFVTDYGAQGEALAVGALYLVPTGLDGGYLIWETWDTDSDRGGKTGIISYLRYNADGSVGETRTAAGTFEKCKPIAVDGRIVWDAMVDGTLKFYMIDENGLTVHDAGWQNPDGIKVRTNGAPVWWTDAEPFIDANKRTMVPLRAVAEALGLTVSWNSEYRFASFTDGSRTISFPIGQSVAYTTEGEITIDTAAVIVEGRTYAPIRYLAEYFGYIVDWDGATRTVVIDG